MKRRVSLESEREDRVGRKRDAQPLLSEGGEPFGTSSCTYRNLRCTSGCQPAVKDAHKRIGEIETHP